MGNTKRKNLVSTYLTAVPLWAGVGTNFLAGAVCRLMITVFLLEKPSAVNVMLRAAATVFSALMLNITSYLMCSTFMHRNENGSERKIPVPLVLAGFAASFAIGAAAAPGLFMFVSHE